MADDAEFWWIVFEPVTFEVQSRPFPFSVEQKHPEGLLHYLAVFRDYADALKFADGDGGKVKCAQVTRGERTSA